MEVKGPCQKPCVALGSGVRQGAQRSQTPPGLDSGEGLGQGCVLLQVDVVSRSGERIPVSVWMKKVKQEHSLCCVVVLEPVERVSAWVAFQSDVSVPSTSPPHGADQVSPLVASAPSVAFCAPLGLLEGGPPW